MRVQLVLDDAARDVQSLRDLVADDRGIATVEPVETVDVISLPVDRRDDRDRMLLAELVVLRTAARRDVDDARSLFRIDLVPRDHDVPHRLLHREVGQERLELEPDELRAVE